MAIWSFSKDLAPAAAWDTPSMLDITDEVAAQGFDLARPADIVASYAHHEQVLAPSPAPPGTVGGAHVGWRNSGISWRMVPPDAPGQPPTYEYYACNMIPIGVRLVGMLTQS